MNKGVYIIAEAGVNHNGDIDTALALVDCASDVGANAVKFQTFKTEELVTQTAPIAEYQRERRTPARSQFQLLKRLELDRHDHLRLMDRCRERRIDFLSTAFDILSVDLLVDLGVRCFKIPSGEITNLPYLRHIGARKGTVILSTGMATLDEIGASLSILERAGTSRDRITILQCNTEYPSPIEDMNLNAMLTIRDAFGVSVGCSDHTPGIEVPIAATALGARIIEKHFTLDRAATGPDHGASLEVDEFRTMVAAIRTTEHALGDGVKQPSASELKNIAIVRKSIVATRYIRQGEKFQPDNVSTKRPGTGVSPMRWDDVIGSIARRDFRADELIEL